MLNFINDIIITKKQKKRIKKKEKNLEIIIIFYSKNRLSKLYDFKNN